MYNDIIKIQNVLLRSLVKKLNNCSIDAENEWLWSAFFWLIFVDELQYYQFLIIEFQKNK